MSDPTRHTRVTAELAAFSRPTHKILRADLIALLDETVPEEGVLDVSAIDAPVSASNMHVRRIAEEATTDHQRPTLKFAPLVRPADSE
jgi:hypothetical protein